MLKYAEESRAPSNDNVNSPQVSPTSLGYSLHVNIVHDSVSAQHLSCGPQQHRILRAGAAAGTSSFCGASHERSEVLWQHVKGWRCATPSGEAGATA
jgi:hypothetical protein